MCVVLANSTGVVQHITPTMRQLRVPAFLLPEAAVTAAVSSSEAPTSAPRTLLEELEAEMAASYRHGQGGVDEGVYWGSAAGDGELDAGKTMAARRDHDGEAGGGGGGGGARGGGGRRRRSTDGSAGAGGGAGAGGTEVSSAYGIVRSHIRAVVASHDGDMVMAIPDAVSAAVLCRAAPHCSCGVACSQLCI